MLVFSTEGGGESILMLLEKGGSGVFGWTGYMKTGISVGVYVWDVGNGGSDIGCRDNVGRGGVCGKHAR